MQYVCMCNRYIEVRVRVTKRGLACSCQPPYVGGQPDVRYYKIHYIMTVQIDVLKTISMLMYCANASESPFFLLRAFIAC